MFHDVCVEFPQSAVENLMKGLKAGNAHLCVLVREGSEQATTHVFSKVKKLLTPVGAELHHRIATLNDDLAVGVHAKGPDHVYKDIDVRSETVKDCL